MLNLNLMEEFRICRILEKDREKLKNKNGNDLFKKPIFIEGKKR